MLELAPGISGEYSNHRRLKMRKIAFLFISILAIAFVIASPAMAQGPEPPFQEKGVLPDTLLQDPELGSLWKKYTRLLNSDKISLNDLQNMIASEKSEKAKLLGIVIREPSRAYQCSNKCPARPGLGLGVRRLPCVHQEHNGSLADE
jgi:hypothetical protein